MVPVDFASPAHPAAPVHAGAPRADAASRPRVRGWELVQLAAVSSLTETYLARPAGPPDARPPAYALKLLRRSREGDVRAVQLLRREAEVGRAVRHPHLVPVLSASVREAPYFVVTPWLTGRTLAGAWRPDLPVALWIARQTAEALAALHEAGWMHGDVKPENIHVSPGGHVTLLDLGFARRPGQEGPGASGCLMGTCAYLAPEAAVSALRPDIRSDLYSLGVVLFEMLAGRLPFAGRTPGEMVAHHRQTRAPDLRRLVPHLPTGVVRLVRGLLAKEPLRRPQTPAEVVRRLVALEVFTFGERDGWTVRR